MPALQPGLRSLAEEARAGLGSLSLSAVTATVERTLGSLQGIDLARRTSGAGSRLSILLVTLHWRCGEVPSRWDSGGSALPPQPATQEAVREERGGAGWSSLLL